MDDYSSMYESMSQDDLIGVILDQEATIQSLQAELQKCRDDIIDLEVESIVLETRNQAEGRGMRDTYEGKIRQIGRSWKRAEDDVTRYLGAIQTARDNTLKTYNSTKNKVINFGERLDAIYGAFNRQPFTGAILRAIFQSIQDLHAAEYDRITDGLGSEEHRIKPTIQPRSALTFLQMRQRNIGALDWGILAFIAVEELATKPPEICQRIMLELKEKGRVTQKTIMDLPIEWIEQNLANPPATHHKLWEGLNWAHKQRQSAKSIYDYANFEDTKNKRPIIDDLLGERPRRGALSKYSSWYTTIEQEATMDVVPKHEQKMG